MDENNNENLELYKEYNKTLRTWLVAYGIALPALFISSSATQTSKIKNNQVIKISIT